MRILLADDQARLPATMQLWLEQIPGFALAGVVTDVPALLAQAPTLQPDLLLLDWDLPGLTDIAARRRLLEDLRQLVPAMRIVALTTEPVSLRHALLHHVDAFVSKSESPEYLAQVLVRLQKILNEAQ